MEMDHIDNLAASTLDGYLVRKDLVRTFSRQFPVPTYVVEFLLGRYCASTDIEEIEEGLEIVQRQLKSRTVKASEEELFKARAREKGSVKIIDLISTRLDARTDSYLATLPSLQLRDVRIGSQLVNEHERMLTGGFYAEITLTYDATIAQEKNGRPFGIEHLRAIQLSNRDVLNIMAEARQAFTTDEWKAFLLRSIGIEPEGISERAKDAFFLLRAFDAAKSGAKLGVAALIALCTSLVKKSVRGGLIIVGEINLGGSIKPVHNAVTIAEIAVEKGATALLMPVACRRQLFELSDDMATKISIQFYSDARDALLKAMVE